MFVKVRTESWQPEGDHDNGPKAHQDFKQVETDLTIADTYFKNKGTVREATQVRDIEAQKGARRSQGCESSAYTALRREMSLGPKRMKVEIKQCIHLLQKPCTANIADLANANAVGRLS